MANFIRWNPSTHIYELSTNDGVSFVPLPLNASIINEGTINQARLPTPGKANLPASIAYEDEANIFTQGQSLICGTPAIGITDSSQAADLKTFRMINVGQLLYFQAMTDAGAAASTPLILARAGHIIAGTDIYEKGRAAPIGHWQNQAFNAAHYSGVSPLVWTVGSAAVLQNRYAIVGKTLFWHLYISWFSGSNVLSGSAGSGLNITLPGGLTHTGQQMQAVGYSAITGVPIDGLYAEVTIGPQITIRKVNSGNFATTDIPGFITTFVIELA